MSTDARLPLILPHDGARPRLDAPAHAGRGSLVIGTASLGPGARLGAYSVIRGDGQTIAIGADFALGARSTVHIATDTLPTVVGDRVSVGRNAVIHACTLGSDVVVEDDAVVLDGAVVGERVLIEAGATVFPRTHLEPGFAYGGSPAERRGPITREELSARARALAERLDDAEAVADAPARDDGRADDARAFVASTARLSGAVQLGPRSSVFFSCLLEAGAGPITVGADTNIQDNTVIRTRGAGASIGEGTTIGHNVHLGDCRIGAGSLIGIGCVLAPGTVVADDVLLAGGARTEPGQILAGGHLWGGRPARILSDLDGKRRAMMTRTIEGYRAHGRRYRALEAGGS